MSALNNSCGSHPAEFKAQILVVDDTPADLLAMRSILEELNQSLVSAQSGEEALRHAQSQEFAVILLDMSLPGIDGFETARRIRTLSTARHTPVMFVTGDDIERA